MRVFQTKAASYLKREAKVTKVIQSKQASGYGCDGITISKQLLWSQIDLTLQSVSLPGDRKTQLPCC